MGQSWVVTMLVLATQGPLFPMLNAEATEPAQALKEIASGCHRLIMAHECKTYQQALHRLPRQAHARILADYLATVRERQSACRCDLAAGGSAGQAMH